MHRRSFIGGIGTSVFAAPALIRASQQPVTRLGIIADPQYADIEAKGTRFYRQSIAKLAEAIQHFNQCDLAWCVNLGDTIDMHWPSFDTILASFRQSKHPFYHVLGNHDFDVDDEYKNSVSKRLGMPQRYYAVSDARWRFLFLDTTDVSLYAQVVDSAEYAMATAAYESIVKLGSENAKTWNSAVGDRQLQWLDGQAQQAKQLGQRVMIMAHHPVFPSSDHTAWNADRIRQVLHKHRHIVAWFNGHNHAGAFGEEDGLPFITHRGMVETESTNAYSTLELFEDRMVLHGYDREPSRELKFRT